MTAGFDNLPETSNEDGVILHRVDSKRAYKDHCNFSEMISFILRALPLSEKLQNQNKYDICLVFFGIPSGPLGYVLKKKYQLPYIIRFGGGDVPGFQERFTKVYKMIGPAIKVIWRNASSLIANSKGLRDMAMDYYDKKDFDVVPNGVDTYLFKPLDKEKEKDCVNILFAARLIERKGLQFIIPNISEICNGTNEKIRFTIVGDGPYREVLESIVKENHADDKFSFVGHKEKSEIVEYYQKADIFILPSKKEGMPNAVLEAMACGLPIIMTPCQGAEELIDGNGYVVEIATFPDKIKELVNDSNRRKAMGLKSRERACNLFGWERTADAYINIMRTVINR